jgi:hypothetical protein
MIENANAIQRMMCEYEYHIEITFDTYYQTHTCNTFAQYKKIVRDVMNDEYLTYINIELMQYDDHHPNYFTNIEHQTFDVCVVQNVFK